MPDDEARDPPYHRVASAEEKTRPCLGVVAGQALCLVAVAALMAVVLISRPDAGETRLNAFRSVEGPSRATEVVRIALTGGPCAGKTSALTALEATARAAGFRMMATTEIATLMRAGGCDEAATPVLAFQTSLAQLQLGLEDALTAVGESTGLPTILITDRGALDAKSYMPSSTWSAVLDAIDSTEESLLSRYDGVIHLLTAADGARQFYKWGNVTDDSGHWVYRKESPEEAIVMDRKTQAAWAAHPRRLIIPNAGPFSNKTKQAAAAMLKIAHETHPGLPSAR